MNEIEDGRGEEEWIENMKEGRGLGGWGQEDERNKERKENKYGREDEGG